MGEGGANVANEPGYDTDKVDDMALALLYLTMWQEDLGYRAWKGLSWDITDRLYEKGYIGDPKGQAKSVIVTAEGYARAQELFERHFRKTSKVSETSEV
jgi:hypothetical protein